MIDVIKGDKYNWATWYRILVDGAYSYDVRYDKTDVEVYSIGDGSFNERRIFKTPSNTKLHADQTPEDVMKVVKRAMLEIL